VPAFEESNATFLLSGQPKPKKAFAAYYFFSQHYREQLKGRKTGQAHTEVTKDIASSWGQLSKENRGPYENQAIEDR